MYVYVLHEDELYGARGCSTFDLGYIINKARQHTATVDNSEG